MNSSRFRPGLWAALVPTVVLMTSACEKQSTVPPTEEPAAEEPAAEEPAAEEPAAEEPAAEEAAEDAEAPAAGGW